MEKRIFAAIGVSIAFLWLWAYVAPRMFPQLAPKKPAAAASKKTTPAPATPATSAATVTTTASAPAQTAVKPTIAKAVVAPVQAAAVADVVVETDNYIARFTNRGAELVSFRLRHYKEKNGQLVDLVKERPANHSDYPFAVETRDAPLTTRLNTALYAVTEEPPQRGVRTIRFRYAGADGVAATKIFRMGDDYLFTFEVAVTPPVPYRVVIGPGIRNSAGDTKDSQYVVIGNGVVRRDEKTKVIQREKGDRLQIYEGVEFIGIEDNFFLATLKPQAGTTGILRRMESGVAPAVRKELYAGVNATNGVAVGSAFLGPKETKVLDRAGLGSVLQFGFFGIIARFLLEALVWINQFTKNYGWAIVVLTILIKIILYPLQHKSIVSMKKMQKVAPKMEAIKSKYKKAKTDADQRQKMNVEMMKLYQVEGINPMSGCIPILLQMPILWGFYGLLSQAIELRGAYFMGWIKDLSEKDPYYITPILMTATMFIQTYITPTTGDPAQRRIFLIMPLVFGWIFKEFPSGLVLYWLVQNILTIIQQTIMNKWWKDHPEELQKA